MWCVEPDGSYELTGRPCDTNSDGTYGAERKVLSSLILAVGPPRSGVDSTKALTNWSFSDSFIREPENVSCTPKSISTDIIATNVKNPSFKYDLFNASADTYKYMVIEGKPTMTDGSTFTLGVYPSAGQNLIPPNSSPYRLSFECNGLWQKRVIDLSAATDWKGRMNYLRMDLFDDTGIGVLGEGFELSKVHFFKTLSEANSFVSGKTDNRLHGDADNNGKIDLLDVTGIIKHLLTIADAPVGFADYNGDGETDLADATFILRKIAG